MTTPSPRWVLGHRVTPIETGGDFGLLSIVSPGHADGPPPHYHEDAAEMFLILDGQMEVVCDGQPSLLGPGDSFVVPKGSVHTFRNPTGSEVKWITTFAPRGFEKFFLDFGVPIESQDAREASLDPQLLSRVIAEAASYGMILALPKEATA